MSVTDRLRAQGLFTPQLQPGNAGRVDELARENADLRDQARGVVLGRVPCCEATAGG